jgi:phosphoribosylanthranilate isomerase
MSAVEFPSEGAAGRVRRVAVKICGLTRGEDAAHAERVGASYLGVILASGPRLLDVHRAAHVLGPRRNGVSRVAVFGSQSVHDIVEIVRKLDLDVAQLHGEFTADDVATIRQATGRAVWPVLRVEGTCIPAETEQIAAAASALVLDAHVIGQLGGTGVTLDWAGLARDVAALRVRIPGLQLVLAGGLRSRNVGEALRLLSPDVVDVSSGVEASPGVKDPAEVERFLEAVRDAAGNEA